MTQLLIISFLQGSILVFFKLFFSSTIFMYAITTFKESRRDDRLCPECYSGRLWSLSQKTASYFVIVGAITPRLSAVSCYLTGDELLSSDSPSLLYCRRRDVLRICAEKIISCGNRTRPSENNGFQPDDTVVPIIHWLVWFCTDLNKPCMPQLSIFCPVRSTSFKNAFRT